MIYQLLEDVSIKESLFMENVVRQRHSFNINQLEEKLEQFVSEAEALQLTPTGQLMYSMNNTPLDEIVDIEFFLPIEEVNISSDQLHFSSYLEFNNIIYSTLTHDYQSLTEEAYAKLFLTLENNDRELVTPFYHLFSIDNKNEVTIFVSYAF
ncbi:DUF5085 family protein [Streptococcus parauberis]|uniref:DUF5085 family protein n=1 Tax=Streptococcus parauberis TaxID=1348 RepID=UPI000CCDB740|nr:DUF5085 family protein [Streptococcus parauberis]PNY19781.1 hypothetical protein ASN86_00606 [Streptococcus parauberis]